MQQSALLIAAATLPLLLSFLMAFPRLRRLTLVLAPWSALPALGLAFTSSSDPISTISWLLLGAKFGLTPLSWGFLAFTAFLWWSAGIYAQGYLAKDPHRNRFFFYYLLAMAGNLGLIVSEDMISFYSFFTLMTFSSYPLVVHNGNKEALFAGKVYIILALLGEVLLFAGMVIAAQGSSSIAFSDLGAFFTDSNLAPAAASLLVLGLGIKVGVLPLHVWLPLAHPAAPTPASALLSGAMIKAGLLGWLKFLPIGLTPLPLTGAILIAGGMTAAFYGVIVGLVQNRIKTILAYSSISQMGLMTAIAGGGALAPWGFEAFQNVMLLWATQHALAKSALFLSVGLFHRKIGNRVKRAAIYAGVAIASLSLVGAPFTFGLMSKTAFKAFLPEAVVNEGILDLLLFLLPLSSLGTFLLLFRFCFLLFGSHSKEDYSHSPNRWGDAVWGLTTLLVGLFPFFLVPLNPLISASFNSAALWPLIFGGVIAAFFLRFPWQPPFAIPEGDILVFYSAMWNRAAKMAQISLQSFPFNLPFPSHFFRKLKMPEQLFRLEYLFSYWAVFGTLFTLFVLLFLQKSF